MKTVTATEYKNNALKLLELVHSTGEPVKITKRGRSYAQLVPSPDVVPERVKGGQFNGQYTIVGDIVGPIIDESDWSDLAS